MRSFGVFLALSCLPVTSCVDDTAQPGLGCESPVEPIPGPSVVLGELGDPSEGPVEFEATDCVIAQNELQSSGVLLFDLDCNSSIIHVEVPAALRPEPAGTVGLRVVWTEDHIDLRVIDDLGPLLVILDGVIEPALEPPLSWQLETNCSERSGEVPGHLIVRTTNQDELRVDVGESEDASDGSSSWQVQTFAAAVDLEAELATGSIAFIRLPK